MIACEPTASDAVVHCACPTATLTAAQPAIVVPPSLKSTVPVGDEPLTVAVNVTGSPNVDGFCDDATVVVVAASAGLTTCVSTADVLPRLPASPE